MEGPPFPGVPDACPASPTSDPTFPGVPDPIATVAPSGDFGIAPGNGIEFKQAGDPSDVGAREQESGESDSEDLEARFAALRKG